MYKRQIDECWLDVTGSSSLKGDGLLIAQEISRRMKSELGITVSVGVSFNKIFAKLGSDYKKPAAITTMYKSEFKQKAWSLAVADLLYVGKSTNRKLALFGIKTMGDLARADEDVLNSHPVSYTHLDVYKRQLMDVFIGQFLYVAVFPDNLNKP